MGARRRWSHLVHSFRAGLLSPAAQDQIDSEAWLQGAARLDNLNVERDGGVSGRPAFVRSDVRPPQPRYGLLAGQSWSTTPGPGAGASTAKSGTFPATLYDTPGGVAEFDELGVIDSRSAPLTNDLIKVNLASGLPRAIAFHGATLEGGEWQGQESGQNRLNLRVVGHLRSESNPATVVRFDRPAASGSGEDPLTYGKFAPGRVPRDIVVRLAPYRNNTFDQEPVDLDWVAIRFARTGAARTAAPLRLSIAGVSCFSDTVPPSPAVEPVELGRHVLDAPFRILSWPIRDLPFVLALGMDWVSMLQIRGDGSLVRRQGDDFDTRAIWHFTERQLRELTWTRFGGNLLLCHKDFPYPLEVHLPRPALGSVPERGFGITPLAIENLPVLSLDAQGRIAPQIAETGELLSISGGGDFPQIARYVAAAFPSSLRVTWQSTGADRYKVYWTEKTNYDREATP